MTKIKFADDREGKELTPSDIGVGKYLYNTETGALGLVADLETPADTFYGVLDLKAEGGGSHDTSYMFSILKDSLVDGDLKGKYLPVSLQNINITANLSVNEYNQISKEYLPKVGDVFYHTDSEELFMLVNYTTDDAQWTLVSLTTGYTLEASNYTVVELTLDDWDKDLVFNEIATLVNDRVLLPVSDLEIKYALK